MTLPNSQTILAWRWFARRPQRLAAHTPQHSQFEQEVDELAIRYDGPSAKLHRAVFLAGDRYDRQEYVPDLMRDWCKLGLRGEVLGMRKPRPGEWLRIEEGQSM